MRVPTEPFAHAAFCSGQRIYETYIERRDPRKVFEAGRNLEFIVADLLVFAHYSKARLLPEEIASGALDDARETIRVADRANRYGDDPHDDGIDWDAERKSAEVARG